MVVPYPDGGGEGARDYVVAVRGEVGEGSDATLINCGKQSDSARLSPRPLTQASFVHLRSSLDIDLSIHPTDACIARPSAKLF